MFVFEIKAEVVVHKDLLGAEEHRGFIRQVLRLEEFAIAEPLAVAALVPLVATEPLVREHKVVTRQRMGSAVKELALEAFVGATEEHTVAEVRAVEEVESD